MRYVADAGAGFEATASGNSSQLCSIETSDTGLGLLTAKL